MEEINYYYDPGLLTVYDANPLPESEEKKTQQVFKSYKTLLKKLTTMKEEEEMKNETRKLANQYKDFDIMDNEVVLPEPITEFPRFKRLPEARPMTKWETFAKKKGIKKKTRKRLVWSEDVKDWVPRYGRNSIKKIQEERDGIREAKPGEEFVDVFQRTKDEKNLAKARQKLKETKNQANRVGPENVKKYTKGQKSTQMKEKLTKAINNTEMATASMGKFDSKSGKAVKQKGIRKKGDKKVFKDFKTEYSRDKDILKKVLNG